MKSRLLRSAFIGTVLLGALSGPALAAADGEIDVHIESVDDAAFPLVRAIIRADQGGRPLESITPDQLRVTESGALGRVQSIVRAVDAQIPLGLVLVIDISGSMAGAPLAGAKASAAAMVRSMAEGDAAALIAFSNGASIVQPMTTDRAALLAAINGLVANGNTALYAAVGAGAQVAAESAFQRRAVILLSDGREAGGQASLTRDMSLDAVSTGGVLFYTVGFGNEIDRSYLEEVSRRSRGRFFVAPTVDEMTAIFAILESLLRSQYVLTFASTSTSAARERSIAITVQSSEGTGEAQRSFSSSQPIPATTPVAAIVIPVQQSQVDREPARGGVSPIAAGLAVVGIVGVLAIALLQRRRLRARILRTPSQPDVRPLPVQNVDTSAASSGRLAVLSDPTLAQVELSAQPVTVGSATHCSLRLPAATGVALEHVRIWMRDGRPMLHHLDPDTVTLVNGHPVSWASIGDSDEIVIGPYILRYDGLQREATTGIAGGAA